MNKEDEGSEFRARQNTLVLSDFWSHLSLL
jgi:hypothetical protein